MNEDENRNRIVRYWWEKAVDSLDAATRETDAGQLNFAMNRLYYSVFYAVSAALLDRRISFKKHSGVRAAFHREFIKSGLLEVEWAGFYDRLFEDRQEGDYIALVTFDLEYVRAQLARCLEFQNRFRLLIPSIQ